MSRSRARLSITPEGIRRIEEEFINKVNSLIQFKLPVIQRELVAATIKGIASSPVVTELLSGGVSSKLDAELGTNSISVVTAEMLEIFSRQSKLTFVPFKSPGTQFLGAKLPSTLGSRHIDGFFRFEIIESDFEEVLNISKGSYVSSPSKKTIDWLRWILIEGFRTIDHWEISYQLNDEHRKRSRTNKAIMRREHGSHWAVPEPFRGDDIDDNFVIRAVESANLELTFVNIIKKHIG